MASLGARGQAGFRGQEVSSSRGSGEVRRGWGNGEVTAEAAVIAGEGAEDG